MHENSEINYICFVSRKSIGYLDHNHPELLKLKSGILMIGNLPFVRLFFWYDRIHIAKTSFYQSLYGVGKFHRYDFIEDTFGHEVKNSCKEKGLDGWSKYHCLLYYPNNGQSRGCTHLNGRKYIKDGHVHKEKIMYSVDSKQL
jgi:hypothetical protein